MCLCSDEPIEDACAESFIGRLRDECLNENWFVLSLQGARDIVETWRIDYNDGRPHGSLRGLSPKESEDSSSVWPKTVGKFTNRQSRTVARVRLAAGGGVLQL